MAAMDHDVTTTLLLSLLCFVLAVGMLLVICVIRWNRRRAVAEAGEVESGEEHRPAASCRSHAAALRRAECWLAVRSQRLSKVQEALGLQHPRPWSLTEGVAGHTGQKLFLSPPISGWVLVMGSALPEPGEDADACFRFLTDLSRKLGEVQMFSVNTMFNHHAWVRLDAGRVVRAYAWAGQVLWNQGFKTSDELILGMKCFRYGEGPAPTAVVANEDCSNNTDKVHVLAGRWSLDPEDLDERFLEREWGVVGETTRNF